MKFLRTMKTCFSKSKACRILAAGLLAMLATATFAADPAPIAKHERWVTSLVFSPDGNLLITAGGESLQYRPGDVKLWDARTGAAAASLEGHPSNVWDVAISSDGSKLVTSGYDGKAIVWSVAEKKPLVTVEKRKGWCRGVAFTPVE